MHRTAVRLLLMVVLTAWAVIASAETLITEAKVAEITERGFMLRVGSELVPVQDESATRFWKVRAPSSREAFAVGETVNVRLKTDVTPAVLREISDPETAKWLDQIRKEITTATIVRVEAKTIAVRLADGSNFTYRISDKSDFQLKGKPVGLSDLAEGLRVYIKGRLLPSLDTWIVTLSDIAPTPKSPTSASGRGKRTPTSTEKPLKIPVAGTFQAVVQTSVPSQMYFDVWYQNRLLHVFFNVRTLFTMGGAKVGPNDLRNGIGVTVGYRRDQFGRIIATKVEIYEIKPPG